MKLWGGRFRKGENKLMEEFNKSFGFDCVLYKKDIEGSLAHVYMQVQVGLLTDEEGKESNFELLDLVELDNEEYVVLLPVDDEESEEPGEVVILKVEDSDDDSDEETESYVSVEDEETLTKVFEIFKDKFKNEFDFVD